MLKFIALLMPAICLAGPCLAMDAMIKKELQELDPSTRLEQTCDTEAMRKINADKNGFSPDKVIAYTFRDPKMGENSMNAPGAVFRSRGDWYHLSYNCVTGPKHINVRELDYRIGAKVPREKWEKFYLYD